MAALYTFNNNNPPNGMYYHFVHESQHNDGRYHTGYEPHHRSKHGHHSNSDVHQQNNQMQQNYLYSRNSHFGQKFDENVSPKHVNEIDGTFISPGELREDYDRPSSPELSSSESSSSDSW
eukprot:CAMPEP_0113934188 /NCGR_PEP_ID=MMETSP1339-20121228/1522_1 /TAXON_ID=94617 /ORGANISM="Fibrocapsa japonica" /LENGTH=119 /DNA_ID=CAMNT_0000935879 /DNA_START=61 /DNA_END=417 /DNA_ORIENTATION=+ /assembly_acc=CAM_ASM_000762